MSLISPMFTSSSLLISARTEKLDSDCNHRLGESKYARLEQTGSGALITPPSEEEMEERKRLMEECGLSVTIGG